MPCREVAARRSDPPVEPAASRFRRLLRARRKRPGDCAAEERNEFASFHWIEPHFISAQPRHGRACPGHPDK
jgi:hypothetical protein